MFFNTFKIKELFNHIVKISKSRDYIFFLLVMLVVLFMRLATSAGNNVFHSYDTGNIALAVQNYNISEDRPHLPGYYLYVQLIRCVNFFTADTHTSVILLQSIFSALGVALLFLLLRKFNGIGTSLLITLFAATNPILWYYGSVTEIYSFDIFISVLFVLTGLNRRYIFYLPIIFAIAAGVRQSTALILLPLYIYFWRQYIKETHNYGVILTANALGLVLLFAWLIPMLDTTGGLSGYFELIRKQNPVPSGGIMRNVLQMFTIGAWLIVPLALVWIFTRLNGKKMQLPVAIRRIVMFWVLPALFVFITVHYARGYWLVAAGGLFMLIAGLSKPIAAKVILIILIVLQSAYFLFMPYKLTSAEIFFVSGQRSINRIDVICDRFLSQNALTLEHIREQDKMVQAIEKYIKNKGDYKYYLIDPTVPLYARVLQAVEPGLLFAELNLIRKDGWFLYADKKQINLTARRKLIDSALIIGTNCFVNMLGSELIEKKHQAGNLVFYTVRGNKADSLLKIYQKYFQKSR